MELINTLKTDGFEMKYIRFGTGEKTLVILPGLSVQSVIPVAMLIEKQYEIFKDEFTVYLFDRREDIFGEYSVYDMADDTANAISELGLSDIYLFGTSQGGMIAMTIAARRSGLVKKLALASSACKVEGKRLKELDEWISLAKEGKSLELYMAFGKKIYSDDTFAQLQGSLAKVSDTVTEHDLKRFTVFASGTKGFDISSELERIKCPVLVVGDKDDKLLGASAAYDIVSNMEEDTHVESYIYEGFGHAVYDMAPDFTKRLYNFFTNK